MRNSGPLVSCKFGVENFLYLWIVFPLIEHLDLKRADFLRFSLLIDNSWRGLTSTLFLSGLAGQLEAFDFDV